MALAVDEGDGVRQMQQQHEVVAVGQAAVLGNGEGGRRGLEGVGTSKTSADWHQPWVQQVAKRGRIPAAVRARREVAKRTRKQAAKRARREVAKRTRKQAVKRARGQVAKRPVAAVTMMTSQELVAW
jgi:hypothetical protein